MDHPKTRTFALHVICFSVIHYDVEFSVEIYEIFSEGAVVLRKVWLVCVTLAILT